MKRWVPVLGVLAVLAVAWLASTLSSPEVTQLPFPETSEPDPTAKAASNRPPSIAVGAAGHAQIPTWIFTVATVLCLAVVAALIGGLLWMFLRSRSLSRKPRLYVDDQPDRRLDPRGDEEEVLAAVDAGLDELSDTDADPRRAVIACWVRLERAAATAGTPREPGDSPTDLVTRLLGAHQVSRRVLADLADVYREARYATHPVDQRARQTATDALRQLRLELAGSQTGSPSA